MSVRYTISDAAGYWEHRRIWYNVALALSTIAWVLMTRPHVRPSMTFAAGGSLLILAILANVFYSGLYLVDVPLSRSTAKEKWVRWRGLVWVATTMLAIVLVCSWIGDEIYPSFG